MCVNRLFVISTNYFQQNPLFTSLTNRWFPSRAKTNHAACLDYSKIPAFRGQNLTKCTTPKLDALFGSARGAPTKTAYQSFIYCYWEWFPNKPLPLPLPPPLNLSWPRVRWGFSGLIHVGGWIIGWCLGASRFHLGERTVKMSNNCRIKYF